jgi:hypothetical protein
VEERKEKKNYARTMYWHDYEPVVRMLNTAGRVVAWGVMPLLGGGLLLIKGNLKVGGVG